MELLINKSMICFRIHVVTVFIFCMIFFFSMYQSAMIPTIAYSNQTDLIALLAFKDRITEDPFGALSSWNNSSHFCTWSGVTCSRRHNERVTLLNLESMSLVGSISPYIGNLSFLRSLDLQNNNFNGEIPEEIGRLFRLQRLNLSENLLEGQIPTNLTYCLELRLFNVMANQLVGKIPAQLGSLSKLFGLGLAKNHLTGTIPASLSNLSSLTGLSLMENNLIGNIPKELGQLSSLRFLQISANNLSGTIPVELFNISSIFHFAAAMNQFHGSIPSNIKHTLPDLQYLSLALNRLSGSLPNTIFNASKLVMVELSNNQFTGRIPPDLGTLQGLVRLNLGGNQLGDGETDNLVFLNSLTNCTHLEMLGLDSNNLTGILPDSVANLSAKLTRLYLEDNQISGVIPIGIENLVNLATLIMRNNLFTGNIPVSIGKLSNLQKVWLNGNQFSGQIPSNICNNSQLLEIIFSNNRLQGRIPPSLGNCRKLQLLSLEQNQLVGTIPKQILSHNNMSMYYIDLSQNHLTGNLPEEIGNLRSIIYLYLSNNKLSGEIPSSLENCLSLNNLSLSGNLFRGFIPASLKSLKGMQYLDLSRNKLSGQIPEYLELFDSLKNLNLSSNDFEGEVPKEGIFRNVSAFSIFGNNKLCGGITELHLQSCQNLGPKKERKQFSLNKMFLITGAIASSILLGLLVIFIWWIKSRKKPSPSTFTLEEDTFQKVSYNELLKATDGFSSDNLVGVGSYGSVYKGKLGQDATPTTIVAVKVLDLQRRGASKSFTAECEALRCIRHRNLVKILTSCSSVDFKGNEFKALVFEFMHNGSLDNWLHPPSNEQLQRRRCLSFMERLNLATDVAYALDYLHHRCQTPIVHCDLKPGNVLLDEDMNGHVGDFGLAKFLSGAINVESGNHTSSVGIRGSVGYAAPEYGMGGEVSTSGDVYSYGILLLEMFTGRRPTDAMFKDNISLHSFAKTSLPDRVMQIIDPTLFHLQDDEDREDDDKALTINNNGEIKALESLISLIRLGVICSSDTARERLEMVQVAKELESIKNVFIELQAGP